MLFKFIINAQRFAFLLMFSTDVKTKTILESPVVWCHMETSDEIKAILCNAFSIHTVRSSQCPEGLIY